MVDNKDEFYMKKALELARKGEGYVSPNPMVGAVVVKNNKIVGEGYHKKFGEAHAEVNALKEAGDKAEGGTLYVNLEPCCHYGKTPPCSLSVIKSGIKKVVIGMEDPDSRVEGKGIAYLKKAGIDIKTGVLAEESIKLNEAFIKNKTTDFPFVYLKSAQTLDGFLATSTGDSKWITCKKARKYGHKLRHKVDAILVGIGTVLKDNPSLTTRLENKKGKDSIRIVLDSNLRIPPDSQILNQKSSSRTIIVTGEEVNEEKITKLQDRVQDRDQIEILSYTLKDNKISLEKLLKDLHEREINSILVEGGGEINYSFINSGLGDKIYSFIAPKIYGGNDGVSVYRGKGPEKMKDIINLKKVEYEKLGDNILVKGYLYDIFK
ncbi:MAG: bifunctional diaminohydroxyphosphoribosylaminopyrimidine deaminase/5-amino-6-(5-phosphoribosylamino)uracil reductase RibD [Bacillota bacterium]